MIFRLYIVFIYLSAVPLSIVIVTCLWWTIDLCVCHSIDLYNYEVSTTAFACLASLLRENADIHLDVFLSNSTTTQLMCCLLQNFQMTFSQWLQNLTDLVPDLSLCVNMLPGTQNLHSLVLMSFFLYMFFTTIYILS